MDERTQQIHAHHLNNRIRKTFSSIIFCVYVWGGGIVTITTKTSHSLTYTRKTQKYSVSYNNMTGKPYTMKTNQNKQHNSSKASQTDKKKIIYLYNIF